jgi:hypothetical protein
MRVPRERSWCRPSPSRSLNDGLNLARNHMVHTPIQEPSLQPLRRAARATTRYTRHIAFGAPDESHRLWLREDEVKYLRRNSSKGYAATFFEREGVWRSSRGYFRLFKDPDGPKGINFSFNYGDLETKETRDPYTDEKRQGFINTGKMNLAKIWGALSAQNLRISFTRSTPILIN